MAENNENIPWPLYNEYFSYHEKKGQNITVKCMLCLPVTKLLSTAINSSSNLRKHLQNKSTLLQQRLIAGPRERSFLGVTAHWINPSTLERESAALACKRLKGKYTFDVLARQMYSIYLDYSIQNKIVCTTTDNGSKFCKAF
ncbi:hypothetical protein ILUMI_14260, partial [Ignelater luminosus]